MENKNTSEEDFKKAIKEEFNYLGIDYKDISDLLAPPIFIDAEYDYSK